MHNQRPFLWGESPIGVCRIRIGWRLSVLSGNAAAQNRTVILIIEFLPPREDGKYSDGLAFNSQFRYKHISTLSGSGRRFIAFLDCRLEHRFRSWAPRKMKLSVPPFILVPCFMSWWNSTAFMAKTGDLLTSYQTQHLPSPWDWGSSRYFFCIFDHWELMNVYHAEFFRSSAFLVPVGMSMQV